MAVYTALSQADFEHLSELFELGAVLDAEFVPQGSINTNVRLTCARGTFFVRHTTVRSADDLEFEAGLLGLLRAKKVPAPVMLRTRTGEASCESVGGRGCVFELISGDERTRAELTPAHLEELGVQLARLHLAAKNYSARRENPYGRSVVERWIIGLQGHADAEVAQAADELAAALPVLPLLEQGTVHADLFIDNVKWHGAKVSALFDFEMACQDALILDVAITLNAWCFENGYRWELCAAFLKGYQSVRALGAEELAPFRRYALFGAVRYTASRIRDFHLSPLPPEKLTRKDFRTYWARVKALQSLSDQDFARRVTGFAPS